MTYVESELAQSLRAMRAACRKFLDTVHGGRHVVPRRHWNPRGDSNWVFYEALGELRGVIGIQVARLAAQHGLDVENDLASILPVKDDDSGPSDE